LENRNRSDGVHVRDPARHATLHREMFMMVVVFRARARADADLSGIEAVGQRMYELASAMPGFISYKEFQSEDKETLTLVEFETEEQLLAWREHPEHLKAQQLGRERVFESYDIAVCKPVRRYGFSLAKGRFEID
jgi:heme-degrading monooxygenase HmoA